MQSPTPSNCPLVPPNLLWPVSICALPTAVHTCAEPPKQSSKNPVAASGPLKCNRTLVNESLSLLCPVNRAMPTLRRNSSIQPVHGLVVTSPVVPTAIKLPLSLTAPLKLTFPPSCTPSRNNFSVLPILTNAI